MTCKVELNQVLKRLEDIEYALNESTIVSIADQKGTIQFVNDKLCEISKFNRDELIGKDHRIFNSGYHPKSFFKDLWNTILSGNIWRGEIRNKAKDGTIFWADSTIVPFLDLDGHPYQFITIRQDITQRKNIEKNMELLAYYDPLTNLPNRHLLNRWAKEAFADHKEENIAVLFLDLDHFKAINDNYGHNIGDLFLKEVGNCLRNCVPNHHFVSRHGGDEFIIILNHIKNNQEIITIANQIIEQLSFPYFINKQQISSSTSIGISVDFIVDCQEDYLEFIETLIKRADYAMYYAKMQGGSTYCFHNPTQNHEMERYYTINKEITKALQQDHFSIVYQPLISLINDEIIGVEALLRWNNPELGSIPPSEFIPSLEELGLIVPVGKWVIQNACNQLKQWQNNGLPLQKVSVNVSPIQFRNIMFVDDVKKILQDTELDPHYLELEVTESTLLNIEESSKKLEELKNLGVKIAIDDFGTGYSSLSYLNKIPIDTLKIDKSFISELDTDGEIIVNTIIHMGKTLKYTVIAEGIENEGQLTYLKQQNCHEGQGYLFSKPVAPEEIYKLFKVNN